MLTPSWYPSSRQLRQFGLAALFGFSLMGASVWRATGSTGALLIGAGAGLLTCLTGWIAPGALRPLYAVLMAVALPIGWVVSNVLLLAIYFGFITPVGWLFRMAGRDHLALRRPKGVSYWRPYRAPKDVGTYFRQA